MIADQAQALRNMMNAASVSADAAPSATATANAAALHERVGSNGGGSRGTLRGGEQPRQASLQAVAQAAASARTARTIAIASGKGGVGKTTLAVNLAVQLSRMKRRTVLLDADLGTANVDVLCNLMPQVNIAHVVAGRKSLADAMIQGPGGFQFIPGASGLAQMASLGEYERTRLMQQLGELETASDIILIDTGAGVSPNVLSFAVAADELLVVTTPEPTSITDAYALIKTATRIKREMDIRLLVNQVRDDREARATYDRIAAVCRRFLHVSPSFAGFVVHDDRVLLSIRRRRPFVLDYPYTPAALCLNQLAHRLDRHARDTQSPGMLRRMAAWLAG